MSWEAAGYEMMKGNQGTAFGEKGPHRETDQLAELWPGSSSFSTGSEGWDSEGGKLVLCVCSRVAGEPPDEASG